MPQLQRLRGQAARQWAGPGLLIDPLWSPSCRFLQGLLEHLPERTQRQSGTAQRTPERQQNREAASKAEVQGLATAKRSETQRTAGSETLTRPCGGCPPASG